MARGAVRAGRERRRDPTGRHGLRGRTEEQQPVGGPGAGGGAVRHRFAVHPRSARSGACFAAVRAAGPVGRRRPRRAARAVPGARRPAANSDRSQRCGGSAFGTWETGGEARRSGGPDGRGGCGHQVRGRQQRQRRGTQALPPASEQHAAEPAQHRGGRRPWHR